MACVGRFPGKKRQNDNVKRGANPDRGSISGYAEIHQAGIFYDKALQPTAQEEFPRAPFLDNFRVAYNPGIDRLGQHCRAFHSVCGLGSEKHWLSDGSGTNANIPNRWHS